MSDAARFFAALGDETRLSIVRLLQRGERTVGELVDEIGCPQPKVSRHLKVLKEVGLARDRRDGRNIYYELAAPAAWGTEARRWVETLDVGLVELGELPEDVASAQPREKTPRAKRPRRELATRSEAPAAVPAGSGSSERDPSEPARRVEEPRVAPRRKGDLETFLL